MPSLVIRRRMAKGLSKFAAALKWAMSFNWARATPKQCVALIWDENGKAQPMVMGCYGIGVTRLLGAAIEQGHDDRGIVWPISMAPFEVVICPVGYDKSESVKAEADALHDALLAAGIDVVLDNRGERPGAMFADWELIGVPYRVVIGERGLKEGQLEFQGRTESAAQNIPLASIKDHVIAAVQAAKQQTA
jgi:prolyl-tRNA synthetase